MISFLTASQNLPFSVSLAMMLIITIMEGVGLLLGSGISGITEHFSPDAHVDVHAPHMESHGALSTVFSWLNIGKVPVMVLLVIFLTCFGLIGLFVQAIAHGSLGMYMPALVVSVGAFATSMPVVRTCSAGLSKVMPKDETTAISSDELIGRMAVITTGKAASKSPAQAKVKDAHDQQHYIMLEPDEDGHIFEQGEKLLLVRREGHIFYAIRNLNENLI